METQDPKQTQDNTRFNEEGRQHTWNRWGVFSKQKE